ncbi:MAG: endonuclease/exonuclease/phosphatase family protein [Clostridiaceae bacterium]
MKLLTLNSHSWMEENQKEKIKILAEAIKELDYDVVALQEVNQSLSKKLVWSNVREDNFSVLLLDELEKLGCSGYNMCWEFSHLCYGTYEEGISIITKHKILEEDISRFCISASRDISIPKTRRGIRISIEIEGEMIDFYSCHMGWWNDQEESFKGQADKLLSTMNKDRLAFLMGDFNNDAFGRSEGYDYFIEKGMKDTYWMTKNRDDGMTVEGKIAGWDLNRKSLRLDWILANKEVDVQYSKVVFNGKNKTVISDHYGVEIEVSLGGINNEKN